MQSENDENHNPEDSVLRTKSVLINFFKFDFQGGQAPACLAEQLYVAP